MATEQLLLFKPLDELRAKASRLSQALMIAEFNWSYPVPHRPPEIDVSQRRHFCNSLKYNVFLVAEDGFEPPTRGL
jgi:hypothetical protein